MNNLRPLEVRKHHGILEKTSTKIIVVFRTIPNDADYSLVVQLDELPTEWRDALVHAADSVEGQNTTDLYTVLEHKKLYTGAGLLPSLHTNGYLRKIPVKKIIMTPIKGHMVPLSVINSAIDKRVGTGENEVEVAINKEVAKDAKAIADQLLLEASELEKLAQEKRAQAKEMMPGIKRASGRIPGTDSERAEKIAQYKEKRLERDRKKAEAAKAEKKELAKQARLDKKIVRDAARVDTDK